jgi:hypothetical protein
LLGLAAPLSNDYGHTINQTFQVTDWPEPWAGLPLTLFSYGRDQVQLDPNAGVRVLARYADGTPALWWRKVGAGQVFHLNAVYYLYHSSIFVQPRWQETGELLGALMRLAAVSYQPPIEIFAADGSSIDDLEWSLAGAGTSAPGAGDVTYVRLAGPLTPQPIKIVCHVPVVSANDALGGAPVTLSKSKTATTIAMTRGPQSSHYVALMPYTVASLDVQANGPVRGGTIVPFDIAIRDASGNPVTGKHAVTLRATIRGREVVQRALIQGRGTIDIPFDWDDGGTVQLTAIDWTSGKQQSITVRVTTPRLVAPEQPPPRLPAPPSGLPRALPPPTEVLASFDALAAIYLGTPASFPRDGAAMQKLGYYTFFLDDSRHRIMTRIAPAAWDPSAMAARLNAGAQWVLTGEDLGIDRLQGQLLTAQDHVGTITRLARLASSVRALAGQPDMLVLLFPQNGRLVLDRRSFDYWFQPSPFRTCLPDYLRSGDRARYSDAYHEFYGALVDHGIDAQQSTPFGLMDLTGIYDVVGNFAVWWATGFPATVQQQIVAQGQALGLPRGDLWTPPAQLATSGGTYAVGATPIFTDQFARGAAGPWMLGAGGNWFWENNQLEQCVQARVTYGGGPWGDDATASYSVAPGTPVLAAAAGQMMNESIFRLGDLGISVANQLHVSFRQGGLLAGPLNDSSQWVSTPTLPSAVTDLLQIVAIVDGNTLSAKAWTWREQPELPWQFDNLQFTGTPESMVRLISIMPCRWANVRLWPLTKL